MLAAALSHLKTVAVVKIQIPPFMPKTVEYTSYQPVSQLLTICMSNKGKMPKGGDNLFLSVISAANCHHYPTSDTETSLGFRLQASQYLKLESSRFSTVFFLSASCLSFLLFILLSGRVASHPPLSYYSLPSHGKYSPMPDAQGNVL